jgi:AhpD family alkylhydroperoxidase
MDNAVTAFDAYRARMNEKILSGDSKIIKRIFNLDSQAFNAGALPAETKELLGLVASAVLRCDDCVRYHLGRCHDLKMSETAIMEALEIATLVGGTIVIPHLRRAVDYWEQLQNQTSS